MQVVKRVYKQYLRKGLDYSVETQGKIDEDVELTKRYYVHATTIVTTIIATITTFTEAMGYTVKLLRNI
jgi:hypothetical protein